VQDRVEIPRQSRNSLKELKRGFIIVLAGYKSSERFVILLRNTDKSNLLADAEHSIRALAKEDLLDFLLHAYRVLVHRLTV
jgi:hypothetical protein